MDHIHIILMFVIWWIDYCFKILNLKIIFLQVWSHSGYLRTHARRKLSWYSFRRTVHLSISFPHLKMIVCSEIWSNIKTFDWRLWTWLQLYGTRSNFAVDELSVKIAALQEKKPASAIISYACHCMCMVWGGGNWNPVRSVAWWNPKPS